MAMIGIQPFEGSACAAGREAPQQLLRRRVAAVVAQYPRRWIRAAEAQSLVTSRRIYDGFRQAGRLCAIIRTSRCTLYRLGDVVACMLHHEDCVSPDDAAGRKLEGYENSAKEINVLVSELLREKINPWVRASALPALFTSRQIYLRCRRAGWLIPRKAAHRCVIYSFEDVLACWHRVEREGVPPSSAERAPKPTKVRRSWGKKRPNTSLK
jgi:hypothetical protein